MPFSIRKATLLDVPELEELIAASARVLGRRDYTEAQIEAALGGAWGVDTELIRDGTYFVAEVNKEVIACGGWSRRKTLFGGDRQAERQSELLAPAIDAARIRAFFVHPDWARQGIGTALLTHCEKEAQAAGFQTTELMATLPGQRFYQTQGYVASGYVEIQLGDGLSITFAPMKKST